MIEAVERIFAVLGERGLSVVRGQDGGLLLRGPKEEVTPALLEAIKAWRTEIDLIIPALPTPEFPLEPWDDAIDAALVAAVDAKMEGWRDADEASKLERWALMDAIIDAETAKDMRAVRKTVAALDAWLDARAVAVR